MYKNKSKKILPANLNQNAVTCKHCTYSHFKRYQNGKSWFLDGKDDKGKTVSKAGPGKPIVAIGGAGFMRSLIATGLIDEYILATHPVALGSGLPIFTDLAIGRI